MTRVRIALLLVGMCMAGLLLAVAAAADEDASDGVVIAEMSTRGPAGGTDNFIRVANDGDAAVDVSGWDIQRCNNSGFSGTQVVVADDRVLEPGEDYLVAHDGGYSGDRAPDQTYSVSITDTGGARVLTADGDVVDGVGFADDDNECTQGEPAAPLTTAEGNQSLSHHRVDTTGDNATDFEKAPRTVDVDDPPDDPDPFDGVRISQTANGGPGGSSDNFIELQNFGDEPVNVAGWEVFRCIGSGGLASSPQVPAFGEVTLEPGENILLGHEDFTGPEPDARYSISLANTGYGVLVRDGSGDVIDRFAAHTGNPDSPCAEGDEFPTSLTFADAEAYHRVGDTGDNASDFEIAERDPTPLGRDLHPEPPPPEEGVRISQTANGGPGGSFDTFIELENFGDEPVDVSGWEVYRCFGSGNLASQAQVPPFGEVTLEPGENVLLAHEEFTGDVEPDALYFGANNLANAGFGVLVQDADGEVVDRFAAHTGNPDSPCADGDEFPDSISFSAAEAFHRVADTGDNASDFQIAERDPQALGRELITVSPICEVMGPGLNSPLVPDPDPEQLANLSDEEVTTTGVVYAAQTDEDFNNGFWMQMADDDDSDCPAGASRGIYVFVQSIRGDTPSMPDVGDEIIATGPINEFFGESTQLQVNNPSGYTSGLWVTSTDNPLPEPTTIDVDEARTQDDERLHYASLHQARTRLAHGQTYLGTNKFGESFLVPGTIDERIRRTDDRWDLFALDDQFLPDGGVANVWAFDEVSDAIGPLDHSFNNYKLVVEDIDAVVATDNQQERPHPIQEQPLGTLGLATFNIEDIFGDPAQIADEEGIEVLAPSDLDEDGNPIAQPADDGLSVPAPDLEERQRRRDMIAVAMVEHMNLPAVVGVQEIANETLLSQMADRINDEIDAHGLDGEYEAILVPGNDERYIDVGYLVDTARVSYDTVEQIDPDASATADSSEEAEVTGRCAQGPEGDLLHDRPPLRIDITEPRSGDTYTMVTVHNKSRFGGTQENEEFEPCRVDQTQSVIDYLDAQGLHENVVIAGDINTFRNSPTLDLYADHGFVNKVDLIPEDRRFTFNFDGRVQFLDHFIVSTDLVEAIDVVDSPKVVNDAPFPQEFEDPTTGTGSSDHDPIIGYIGLPGVPADADIGDVRGGPRTGRTLVVPATVTDYFGQPVGGAELDALVTGATEVTADVNERDDEPGGYNVRFRAAEAGEHTITILHEGVVIGSTTIHVEPSDD